eukprot:Skav206040  [mRNA]  locus=scaffold1314:836404:840515:- [translate_table: standard]
MWFIPDPMPDLTYADRLAIQANGPVVVPQASSPGSQLEQVFQQYESLVHDHLQRQGKPGLLPRQRGRARTRARTFKDPNQGPLKQSRPGDPQPSLEEHNLKYKRWFTQLRRLRSYMFTASSTSVADTVLEQKVRVWGAILRATGFGTSFQRWWLRNHLADARVTVPDEPPSYQVAKEIHDLFAVAVEQYATQVKSRRRAQGQQSYVDNPNLIYRDLKSQRPPPVQVLVAKQTLTVEEVVDDFTVTVTPLPVDATQAQWESAQGFHHVIEQQDASLTCATPHGLEAGATMHVTNLQGTTTEIHAAFCAEWKKRWDYHRHLQPDHWDVVLDWMDAALPSGSMTTQPISLPRWVSTVAAKKKHSATGMDGISRANLLGLPDALQTSVLQIVHHAEQHGEWAPQLMHGSIHSLAKVEDAEEVGQYRPVTILPLIYRCWSTIRKPIFHAAYKLGICPRILRAWEAATEQITRHFWVRGEPSEGLTSVTGLPEGCGLSVVGMVIYDMILHEFVSLRHPQVVLQSYVDNLEFQSEDAEDSIAALRTLTAFTGWFGVPVDPRKTYGWALSCAQRKLFRSSEMKVEYSAPDLGAHMQYSGQKTNFSVRTKCSKLKDLWSSLARSRAPRHLKERAIITVAWPRACHGASTVHLSATTFTEMRRGAMQSMSVSKAGSNPCLHMGLHPNAQLDPEFYCIWDSIQKLRRFGQEPIIGLGLSEAAWTPPRLKKPGPFGALVSRLERLGWRYHSNTSFVDQDDQLIDIVGAPVQEIKFRVKRAWHRAIGAEHSARKGFDGMHAVDVRLSHIVPTESTPEDIGLLHALHNGSFITHDQLHPAGVTDDTDCQFCKAPDLLEHRHWHCPATERFRQHLSAEHWRTLQASPDCLRHRGWMTEPPEVHTFKCSLAKIPSHPMLWTPLHSTSGHPVDLFTDGTCLSPNEPVVRLAAWSVVQAVGVDAQLSHPVIAAGGVPGQWQTIQRAEIAAVIHAVLASHESSQPVRIWCDNALVVRRFRSLQSHSTVYHPAQPDHDLWNRLGEAISSCPCDISIHKVYSHQQSTDDDIDNWLFAGNEAADAAASAALACLPAEVLAAQRAAAQAMAKARHLALAINKVIIDVGRFCIQQPPPEKPAQPDSSKNQIPVEQIVPIHRWVHDAYRLPRGLQFPGFHKILAWLGQLTDETTAPRWVTWYEVFWSFQLYTGMPGVERYGTNSTWKSMTHHAQYDTIKAGQAFAAYLQAVIKIFQPDFQSSHVKPCYYRWLSWGQCVALRWQQRDMQRVHDWLEAQLGTRQVKTLAKDIGSLPPAFAEVACTPVAGLHRYFG